MKKFLTILIVFVSAFAFGQTGQHFFTSDGEAGYVDTSVLSSQWLNGTVNLLKEYKDAVVTITILKTEDYTVNTLYLTDVRTDAFDWRFLADAGRQFKIYYEVKELTK